MRGDGLMQAISRAAALRQEFDQSFADPVLAGTAAQEDLLAIRLAAQEFALRLSEIAGLFADKKITAVPSANAALLGIAGFRGAIMPVYDLQSLLGLAAGRTSRWLAIAARAPVAFSFEAFVGRLQVSPHEITSQRGQAKHSFARDFVQIENVMRPIIQLSSVLDAIMT
jgi:chemotaxis signal transduction protein